MNAFVIPDIPETIRTTEEFMNSVEALQGATLAACQSTCVRKPKGPKRAKWFDSKVHKALRDLRRSRDHLHARKDKHNAIRHGIALQHFRYSVVVAKRSHARAFAASVTPGTNLWRLATWYQGVRKTTVPTLKDPLNPDQKNPTWVSASPAKAKLLAESWFPNDTPRAKDVPYPFPPLPTRDFKSVTNEEVLDTLKECSSDNAPGISGITYRVWKWVALVAPDQLISVVRAAVKLQVHHPSWKQALVAVIPKNNKKDMALPKSHRPIQLIECLGKLVEKIVARRITYDLGRYELMPFNQFGSRSDSSCLDAAMALTHDVHTAREKNLVSSFLAVDIKGFFDHVDHQRMINVLVHLGFPLEITGWVKSFLSERFVRVQVDDCVGKPHPQKVGAPQGSPVSPILACIYSSIVLVLLNRFPIFNETGPDSIPLAPRALVDDYGFLACSHNFETNIFTLRKTLEYTVAILLRIGMKIDPDKCDLMHFTWRRGSPALGHDKNPPLVTKLYGEKIIIPAPKSIRWLGSTSTGNYHSPTMSKPSLRKVSP